MKRRILIVDDLIANRRILGGMLNKDYDIQEAASGEEALELLLANCESISAVLLDIGMPGIDGFEVLHRIREDERLLQMPVIMITGSEDDASRVKALSLGANDYVMKPYSFEVIRHCLKNNIAFREAEATVVALQRDRLTGLYNREAFFEKVHSIVSGQKPGSYIMASFDIDKFKIINDQYGTAKGDEVLQHAARAFSEGFEPFGGVCCRVFADNFAVLYPAAFKDTEQIRHIRERAAHVAGLATPITFSIGRYVIENVEMLPASMYDRAALAAASVKGRYDVPFAFYDETMREHLIREQEIVMEMADALKNRQFEVWFQPQYNHSTEARIGAEALVRWRHPKKGLISPNDFIPVFEKNGFIYSLDRFVWEEVCRYLQKWRDEGLDPLPVSVNMSRYDVLCPDIVDVITGLTDKYGIARELLRLEITESAFTKSSEHIVDVVKTLVDLGYVVEIDDFGSGYSSLNTLKDVPAQIIKLDMRFLDSSRDSRRGGNIVESVVRMAKWLGMSVIAEGVETLEQANYLRSVGCNYMQGYLYARPMSAGEYERHCKGRIKEERLLTLETVDNLDNNAFWDPNSMDTLIFNSYVGAACIYEYHNGNVELLRATEKYAQVIGAAGMTVEDVLKLDISAHLDEENRRLVARDIERSIKTGSEVTSEYVFLNLPGGAPKTHLRSSMRVIASAGERYLVYCTNENITAQRQSEKRERETSELMQAIMDNADLGIIALKMENGVAGYKFVNDRYYQMLGYTREQFEKEIKAPHQTVAEEDVQRVTEQTSRINSTGESGLLVFAVVTRDGRRRIFRTAISRASILGADKPVLLAVMRDVTEEMEVEQRERQAAEQMQSMMQDMPGGFCRMSIDEKGNILPVYFNAGFCRLLSMTEEQAWQSFEPSIMTGVHPEDIETVNSAISALIASGSVGSARYRLRRGNGSYIWLSVLGRITTGHSGETFLNLYYTDDTDRVMDEERQKELLDNLPGGAALYEYADGQLSVIHFNQSYWQLVGRTPNAHANLPPMNAVHPDERAIIASEINSAIQQKRDMVCDIRLLHESQGYCPVHLVGRIVPKEEGYSIYTTFAPISEEVMSYQQMLPVALSKIMEATTDLSFVKDRNFRYITASRAFVNLVGKEKAADLIGKTDYDLFDREMADKYRRDDEALLQSGESLVDIVEAIPSEDNSPHYSSTSKYLLYDGSGDIIGMYGTGRDITKTVLQDSQLSLVNDSIPGGLATYVCTCGDLTPEHIKLTYFNDGFCRMFGYTRNEYERLAVKDAAHMVFKEDYHILKEQWNRLMEDNTPIDCLYRAHINGGGYKWISHRAVAADRQSDRVVINAILQDVTDQREMIEQLRMSEEENKLAVRLGGNAVCRFSVADKTLTLSPETASAYSLPEVIEDVPYGPVSQGMISPESAKAYVGFFESILQGSPAATATFQQKYFQSWRWLDAKGSTVFSDDGKPAKAVISFYDITEMLEKENIYKKWKQSLEDKKQESYTLFRCNLHNNSVHDMSDGKLIAFDFEGSAKLFNERARAYAECCVLEEDRDRYTAFTNADIMLAAYYRGKRSDTLEYREQLPDGDSRWLRLTVDLVEYPNSNEVEAYLMYEDIDEAKREELQTRERSETDALTGVLNRGAFTARAEQIIRASRPGTQHALLMLDVDGFKQVNDVFGHAAGDRALVDIAKALRSITRAGDLVARLGGDEFVLFLNGILNEKSAIAKAKQVCRLVRKSFSVEVQISGSVGIAIAPRDGMDFDTLYKKADSALYYVKGSGKDDFEFYREDMGDQHLELEPDTDSFEAISAEKKRRMLIVEDSNIDYELLKNMFRDEFIIEKAKDGFSALIRLRNYGNAISVVLLDLMMPGMDGFSVLEKMQESSDMQSIPVIIVSGDESRDTCLWAIRAGATDFVTKPVDPDILKIRVRSAVSRAENERLRAQNQVLEVQNNERIRYESALENTGVTFVEHNWLTGEFSYYPSVSHYLLGEYDGRKLWQILLLDRVADQQTVQDMQQLVRSVAENEEQMGASKVVRLKTPQQQTHSFRMNVHKAANDYQPTGKLVITLTDLDYEQ